VTAAVQDTALLVALGELAAEVQRARLPGEIPARVASGLAALGFRVAVLRVAGAGCTVVKVALPAEPRARLEALLARPLEGLTFPAAYLADAERAIDAGRQRHWEEPIAPLLDFFAALGLAPDPDLPRLCRVLSGGKLAIVPVRVGGLAWGALAVGSPSLTAADAAALALFAAQVGAALEVAESLELLARRNRELKAVTELAGARPRPDDGTFRFETEAERRIRFLATLWDLGRIGSEARGVSGLVARVLERLDEALSIDAGAIHALEGDRLVLAGPSFGAWDPLPEEALRALRLDGRELPGLAIAERRTVTERLPDIRAPGSLAARLGVPHSVTVPLLAQDRVVGTLSVVRRGERFFSPEEVQLLEICAAQVAVALENAGLFEQKRRRVQDLSLLNDMSAVLSSQLELPAVLATGVRYLARMFEESNVFLVLREDDGELRMAASSVPTAWVTELRFDRTRPSAVLEAIRTNAPVVIADARVDGRASREVSAHFDHRALIAVPMVSRGAPIGAVVLGDRRPDRAFSRVEVDRVMPMASAIAAAVVNARLFEAERRRGEQLRLLLDVGRTITASLELERILEVSAGTLVQMVSATTAHIFLLDGKTRKLRGAATSTAHRERIRATAIDLDEPSVTARCVATRVPVMVEDTGAPDALVHRGLVWFLEERSVLALPLLVRDEPIGAVVIGDVHGPRTFTGAEIERATLVAHQVAVAVSNARLFADLKQSYAELARAQEELVKRERLAALGELSAVVAHEVRNPLGVIFNALGPLRRLLQPTGDAAMLFDIVGEEADRLNRIVADLLDFARPHVPSLEKASLAGLLEDVVDAVRGDPSAGGIDFVADLAPDLPALPVDARMIRQALLNLVQNAVQALPKGGTVRVAARRGDGAGGPAAVVEIADDGPGIPPELAAKVFEPFFTTKATGTGLGLAVVKRIVEAHGGSIALASPPGGGATFTMRFPIPEAG
jgi:signal transduction histidine kinase